MTGEWVKAREALPPEGGEYTVRRRAVGRKIVEARAVFSRDARGGCWLIPKRSGIGRAPTDTVEEWYREGPDE